MRLKELDREQLEKLVINLLWVIIGLGALMVLMALIAAVLLLRLSVPSAGRLSLKPKQKNMGKRSSDLFSLHQTASCSL